VDQQISPRGPSLVKLAEALGTPVVVENKPGAGGLLATQDLLEQSLMAILCFCAPISTRSTRCSTERRATRSPMSRRFVDRDLRLCACDGEYRSGGHSGATRRVDEGKSGQVQLRPHRIASPANLIFKQLERQTGMKMTAVPFKGSAPAIQEVMAGRLDLYIVPPISAVQPYDAKRIKVLAATGQKRLPALPGVPTLNEAGCQSSRSRFSASAPRPARRSRSYGS
jgi:tripartite-type tricarboxylate transporter receptor subunit TctC